MDGDLIRALEYIKIAQPITCADLCAYHGYTPSQGAHILRRLYDYGKIKKIKTISGKNVILWGLKQ